MEVAVGLAGIPDVPSVEPLWKSMVEHHGKLVGDEWPVLGAEEA